MSFPNGIGLSSLTNNYAVDLGLRDLTDIQSQIGVPNAFGITSRARAQIVQTETQEEDNTTFLFEYRAFLNSQLTTLVTQLTNALTSDLDTIMVYSANHGVGADKPDMQGQTNNINLDPGAARAMYDYLGTWRSTITDSSAPGGDTPFAMTGGSPTNGYARTITDGTKANDGTNNTGDGTIAVMTYGNNPSPTGPEVPNDSLAIDYSNLEGNAYVQSKLAAINVTDPSVGGAIQAGNKVEEVLAKFSRTITFKQMLKEDLIQDLVVSASTNLSTGSQLQASVTINSRFTNQSPYPSVTGHSAMLDIFLNKFTCFYHS